MVDKKQNVIRPGEVEIKLVGWPKIITLRPSLETARILNRRHNGFSALLQKIGAYDLDTYIQVVAVGGGVTDSGMKKLSNAVYDTGILNLMAPLTTFITTMANGGRPVTPADLSEDETSDQGDDGEEEEVEEVPEEDDPLELIPTSSSGRSSTRSARRA